MANLSSAEMIWCPTIMLCAAPVHRSRESKLFAWPQLAAHDRAAAREVHLGHEPTGFEREITRARRTNYARIKEYVT